MAPTLSLVRRDDQIADVDSISLLAYTDGMELADNGWASAVASPGDAIVTEAITLRVKGTTQDNMAAKLQGLDLKLKQARWYADPQELYNVWLRAKLKNETNTRQALVIGGRRSPVPLFTNLANVNNVVQFYALALDRMPYWESTAVVDYSQAGVGTTSALGGMWDYTTYGGSPGAVAGDVPARIAQAVITGAAASAPGPMTRTWLGFRTNRFGNRANFKPQWYLYASVDAVLSDADTTKVADATASNASKTQTTFATVATMLQRNIVRVSDFIPATPNDARGTFMVLLRAKVTGTANVNVRLTDGYLWSNTKAVRSRVNITNTSYFMYEMGVVQIPSPGRAIPNLDIANYSLALEAERVSGAGNLDCDAFILIPMNEGYLTTDQPDATGTDGIGTAAGQAHYVFERPDGVIQGVYYHFAPSGNITVRYSGGLPTGNGIAVVAAQRLASSVKADTVSLEFFTYPRWTTLRGAS